MFYPRGLTLIEWLLLVACLVVVAVILYPVFPRGPREADHRGRNCINNQKQLLLGTMMLAQYHADTLPKADGWSSAIGVDPGTLTCPRAPKEPLGYVYNVALDGKKLDDFKDTDETTVMVTCDGRNAARPGVWEGEANTDYARHGGQTISSFLDGHAEHVKLLPKPRPKRLPVAQPKPQGSGAK